MKKNVTLIFAGLLLAIAANGQSQYKAGDVASDFSLKDVNGKTVSLSQFDDAKGFIITFWSNTCPFAKKYDQRLQDLNAKYAPRGYPVIAINSNDPAVSSGDSYEQMIQTAKDRNYKFEYLKDETQDVARKYGATNTPHVYVLAKKDGKLVVEYVGAIDNNADDASAADKKYVEDALNSLISGATIAVADTRAIGCGIKWKKS